MTELKQWLVRDFQRNYSNKCYNAALIRGYYERNLGCSIKECARDLKLNTKTVSRHIKEIRHSSKLRQ